MLPESLNNRKLWDFLLRVDEFEAERVREEGCRHCGGVLHSGGYVRKPRGIEYLLGTKHAELSFRHSFCCGSCRRRTLPASVRFLGRRLYVGLVVVLLPALLGDGSPAAALSACARLHVSERTLVRWRRWWQEEFSASRFWRGHRGRLEPGKAARLPGDLLARFPRGGLVARGVRALVFVREAFPFLKECEGDAGGGDFAQKLHLSY